MGKSLQEWKVEVEGTLGRALSKNQNEYFETLVELLDMLDWKDSLRAQDIALLDPDLLKVEKDPRTHLTHGLWTEAPGDEYSLWQYIALILEDRELAIPDFLKPHTRTDLLRADLLTRHREKEARLWKNRLGNLSQRREFAHTGSLEARLKLQGRALKWEAKSAGFADFAPLPAKEIGQWLAKDFGFLDRFAAESLPLCALFQEYYRSTQRTRLDLDKAEDCSFVNLLIHRADTRELIVSKDGTPLSISDKRLHWTGSETGPNESGDYRLSLEFENGEPAPFPLIYLPGSQSLYLAGDLLYPGPNLLKADADPNHPFEIPQEAIESPEGLLFLRNQGLELPERLIGQIVAVPLESRLYLNLVESKETLGKQSSLRVSLAAVSRDHKHWFVLTDQGWAPSDNLETEDPSAPAEKGSLFEYPDATPYLSQLREFELAEVDQGIWQKTIDYEFPGAFTHWIQRFPSELQIIADDELDTLVDGKPIGRFALKIDTNERQDWFDVRLEPELLDTSLTDNERQLLLKAQGDFVRIPGKGWKRFDPSVAPSQQALLKQLGLSDDETAAGTHSYHALQLAEMRLEDAAMDSLANGIRKRAKDISTRAPAKLPKGISTKLRPYQEDGFKFLGFLSHNRFGGILADDMGLGKTLQTLTWITWLKLHRPKEEPFSVLVVCPKSVMHVWKQEVERHSELLSIAVFDPARVHPASWQAAEIDILVANYSQLRINQRFFHEVSWTVAILDEGQYIKNPQSQTAKAACALNSEHRVVLTGTPIENRALDLWSLFSFAMPGLLGSQTSFKRQYKESDSESPQKLFNRTRHFMLRRSKKQVAPDLPDRIEETLTCELEGDQRDLYNAELKGVQQRLNSIQSDAEFDKQRFNILSSLLRLRQICCHPRLIDPAYADMKSAKMEALIDHVSELMDEGHKVLIFSQFVEMLEIIRSELETIGCKHLMLTGKTKNREELVDQFQEDESVTAFLLSLRAAGSGLNLTAASYVILYDPWWNPAVEAQAIDRTHRIGQENAVNAYRLLAQGTVEDKIQSLQLQKEALANQVVQEESLNQILNLDRLKAILGA